MQSQELLRQWVGKISGTSWLGKEASIWNEVVEKVDTDHTCRESNNIQQRMELC